MSLSQTNRQDDKPARSWVDYTPLIIAGLITILFFGWIYFIAREWIVIDHVNQTRFHHFLAGTPNAMGDTLAGFVGSLTLIWVIASVFQQSMELRSQRVEFASMAKAQQVQVARIADSKNEELLDRIVEGIVDRTTTYPLNEVSWAMDEYYIDIDSTGQGSVYLFLRPDDHYVSVADRILAASEREIHLKKQEPHLRGTFDELLRIEESGLLPGTKVILGDEFDDAIGPLLADLQRAIDLFPKLSLAQQQRVRNLKIIEFHDLLDHFQQKKSWWNVQDFAGDVA